jgi:hypothetical protein
MDRVATKMKGWTLVTVPVLVGPWSGCARRVSALFGFLSGWSQVWGWWELRVGMNDWGSETDDRLLVAAAVDPGAFAEFYGRYERAMLAFFVHRTREPELAADLTAEVFAAALAGVARFRPGGAPAGGG